MVDIQFLIWYIGTLGGYWWILKLQDPIFVRWAPDFSATAMCEAMILQCLYWGICDVTTGKTFQSPYWPSFLGRTGVGLIHVTQGLQMEKMRPPQIPIFSQLYFGHMGPFVGFEVRFILAQKQVCLKIRYSIPSQFKIIFSMNMPYIWSK